MVGLLVVTILATGPAGGEWKALGQGRWAYAPIDPNAQPGIGHQLVLRSAAELVAATPFKSREGPPEVVEQLATAEVSRALGVSPIDWKKQMLVVVTGGVQRTGGYSVDITRMEVRDKVLTVYWRLNRPDPRRPLTQALTHPAQMALVERFDGPVKFQPAAAQPAAKGKSSP